MTRFVLAVLVSLGASAAFADEPLVCRSVVDPTITITVNCMHPTGRYACDSMGNNCMPEIESAPGCGAVYKEVCLPQKDWILDNGARLN